MPRPKVWGDFTEDASFEGEDDAGDDLVEFTCPYNCGKPIRMKARNVIKNKCTECRLHLIKCNGVRADGQKAEDDPRIKALRVATVECADHMRAVKRGRSSSGLPSTNAVAAQDAHTLARHRYASFRRPSPLIARRPTTHQEPAVRSVRCILTATRT